MTSPPNWSFGRGVRALALICGAGLAADYAMQFLVASLDPNYDVAPVLGAPLVWALVTYVLVVWFGAEALQSLHQGGRLQRWPRSAWFAAFLVLLALRAVVPIPFPAHLVAMLGLGVVFGHALSRALEARRRQSIESGHVH